MIKINFTNVFSKEFSLESDSEFTFPSKYFLKGCDTSVKAENRLFSSNFL